VAAFLADQFVSEALEDGDQTTARHTARCFHAASTGINSSFT
jgi:hypothetical protein